MRYLCIIVLSIAMSACEITIDIEDMDKIDALLDGGITVHVDGIPDTGISVQYPLFGLITDDDDGGK